MYGAIMRGALAATAAAAATWRSSPPGVGDHQETSTSSAPGRRATTSRSPSRRKSQDRRLLGHDFAVEDRAYRLVACHVKGNHYAFTITYGTGYKSYNKGTITANKLKGSFRDTNGASGIYSAVRTKR